MESIEAATANKRNDLFSNPWPGIFAGFGAVSLAFVISACTDRLGIAVASLTVVGILAAGLGVAVRPGSPLILALAALVALIADLTANGAHWDASMSLLFGVMMGVAVFAAVVMLLPEFLRRTVVSLLILFHFLGISSAVLSAAPQSWIAGQMWMYIFRPYLTFLYMNNAYHFYSPEPGPATLLWFHIEYESDSKGTKYTRWIKVPELDAQTGKPVIATPKGEMVVIPSVEYTRRLSLAEFINQPGAVPNNLDYLWQRRLEAGRLKNIPPMNPTGSTANLEYRQPPPLSKHYIQSYVRHVARTYPHESHPELPVKAIKVYRVIHQMLGPAQVAQGDDPGDPTTYWPYFQGEFNSQGNIRPYFEKELDGQVRQTADPFLFWLIPIVRIPKQVQPAPSLNPSTFRVIVPEGNSSENSEYELKNYLLIHAGDEEGGNHP